jgi:FkbM family methyltransferase
MLLSFLNELRRVRGHTIWTRSLDGDSIVVDAGAHRGEFSRQLIEMYKCRCYLVEANPELARRLDVRGAQQTLAVALAAADGHSEFIFRNNAEAGSIARRAGEPAGGGRTRSVAVEAVSLATLMRRTGLGRIDLLKLDIEGAEFDLIAGASDDLLASIGQITVEFHDFLEEFKARGLFERARDRLQALGFVCCRVSFRTHGDVLFLNAARLGIDAASAFGLSKLGRLAARRRLA